MNTAELRAAIARAGTTNRELAKIIGISEQSFHNKIRGDTEFKGSEIGKLSASLNLSMDAVNAIFFN